MKTLATICLTFFVALCALSAQNSGTDLGASNTIQTATTRPQIVVTDINFGTGAVGLPALVSRTFRIINRGNAPLIITKQSGVQPSSMASSFDISDITSAEFPLTLDDVNSGFNVRTFTIKFNPQHTGAFEATIVFSSSATGVDSVCRLRGVGINPGIGVNSVDFGRRRIRDTYESDADGGAAQIMINNTLGGKTSTILKATVSGNTSEFVYTDLAEFTNMVLQPAQQVTRIIKFKPLTTKYDTLRITFQVSTGSPIVFEAIGTGVVPHVTTSDLDFGTIDLNSTTKSSSRKFQITNLDMFTTPTWEFYDDLNIDDLTVLGAGTEVGTGGQATPGTMGFSFDKSQLELPLVIPAGQVSKDFDAWFQPSKIGDFSAQVQWSCDASAKPVSTWSGHATGTPNAVEDLHTIALVYPNPVCHELKLGADLDAGYPYDIVDCYGDVVSSGTTQAKGLDVKQLTPGLYCIRVMRGGRIVQAQFIKD